MTAPSYYLNGVKVGSRCGCRPAFTYSTLASDQANEGVAEILSLPAGSLVTGDNVMAVEVHQTSANSSDDVFGMQLNAVQFTTNIITTSTVGVPVVLNEILASNHSLHQRQRRDAGLGGVVQYLHQRRGLWRI